MAFLAAPSANAQLDVSIYGGPSVAFLQDVKVRDFDLPGRQVWWKEHHVPSEIQSGIGGNARYFFRNNLGVQGDIYYNHSTLNATMEQTQYGSFNMNQERLAMTLSLAGRHFLNRFGMSSVYGTCGLGAVLAEYTYVPHQWVLGGQMSLGTDLLSSSSMNLFIEFKYLWHQDIGDSHQNPGQRMKTSGNPSWNPASVIMGPHYDSQVLGLMIGTRFGFGSQTQLAKCAKPKKNSRRA